MFRHDLFDLRKPGKIQRANLDGTSVETIFTEKIPGQSLRNLVVDARSRKLFWLQKHRWERTPVFIRRANLDGSNVENVTVANHSARGTQGKGKVVNLSGESAKYDFYAFTLDARNGWLYWAPLSDKILRVRMAGKSR